MMQGHALVYRLLIIELVRINRIDSFGVDVNPPMPNGFF